MSKNNANSFPNSLNNDKDVLFNTINVLVVHNKKKDFVAIGGGLLHSTYPFKVTSVDDESSALSLLYAKKTKFDLLLVDRDMSDMDIHSFLKIVNDFDLLSIVMSAQVDDAFELEALRSGACFTITTPLTPEVIALLRQRVIRKKMQEHDRFQNRNTALMDVRDPMKSESTNNDEGNYLKKRIRVEWTKELHDRFMNALNQLGDENCSPQQILELMDVPGLTKMQVSSHLQYVQNKEKKNHQTVASSSRDQSVSISIPPRGTNEHNFGYMSSLPAFENDQESSRTLDGINPSVNGWQTAGVNHIAQPTKNSPFSFGNSLDADQYYKAGFDSSIATTTINNLPQEISKLHDAQPSSDQDPFTLYQTPAFDDCLIYFDGDALNDISEYFPFRNDHVMQDKDTTGRNKHI